MDSENIKVIKLDSGTTVSFDDLKHVNTHSEIHRIEALENGIYEISETLDSDGKPIPAFSTSKLIMSREVFVKAYNKYIKEERDSTK